MSKTITFASALVLGLVSIAGLWALLMFLFSDLQLLTGLTIVNISKAKLPPHTIVPGLTVEDLLVHVSLIALWIVSYALWRNRRNDQSPTD
jgi:hypothetical protein